MVPLVHVAIGTIGNQNDPWRKQSVTFYEENLDIYHISVFFTPASCVLESAHFITIIYLRVPITHKNPSNILLFLSANFIRASPVYQ